MPQTSGFDATELKERRLVYDKSASVFSREPFLSAGLNMRVEIGRMLAKRPGFVTNGNALPASKRLVWMQTSEDETVIASVENTSTNVYELYYRRPVGSWTLVPNLRSIHLSRFAHEGAWIRNKFYVKGFPAAATSEFIGSIVFDAEAETSATWGVEAPTVAAALTSSGGWGASTNPITVKIDLSYAYTYVNTSGHESSIGSLSGVTGSFTDLDPEMNLTGDADTTNIPNINVYRSEDGGGSFYFLEQVSNPGAGTFLYTDNNTSNIINANPNSVLNFFRPVPQS